VNLAASSCSFQSVDVVVTILACGERIFATFNRHWDALTLPMTKLRQQTSSADAAAVLGETKEDAAIRNVVEMFGQLPGCSPRLILEVRNFRQSDRDLVVKDYNFSVCEVLLEKPLACVAPVDGEWLLPAQFFEVRRRAVSPTARFLVEQFQRHKNSLERVV
jgi:hypothetical protein